MERVVAKPASRNRRRAQIPAPLAFLSVCNDPRGYLPSCFAKSARNKRPLLRVLSRLLAGAALAAALAYSAAAGAQQTALLIARPGLPDPNFRESVVLVTQDENENAVGIIINRPTPRSLASVLPGDRFRRFSDPVFFGGPVGLEGMYALFRAPSPPGAAIKMLSDVFLALHPETVEKLMDKPPADIRVYSGYSGWGPMQLRGEIERGDWYVMQPDAELLFVKETKGLWDRLVRKARMITADRSTP